MNGNRPCEDLFCYGCANCTATTWVVKASDDSTATNGRANVSAVTTSSRGPSVDEVDDEKPNLIQQRHKERSRQAFARPPKRMGRGQPPRKKWDARPPIQVKRRGGR